MALSNRSLPRRDFGRVLLGAAAAGALPSGQAFAQPGFPDRTVRIIVGGAPGGGTDFMSRLLAERLSPRWKQPVVVENRAGASGVIGSKYVMSSPPDGYTMIMGHTSTHAIVPALMDPPPYDPVRDFTAVAQVAVAPDLLVVAANSPFKSVQDVIALARAKPGEVTYGSPGVGLSQHLRGFLLAKTAGVEMRHVPYKGTSPALQDLLGGHITIMFATAGGIVQQARDGRVRVIGVSSPKRIPMFPDAPTMTELGFPDLEGLGFFGLFGPAGIPPAVVQTIGAGVAAVLAEPDVRSKFEAQFVDPVVSTPDQFAEFHRGMVTRWKKIVQTSGVKTSG
jgi:tripartite-type tricarboxylate transporter receptor subunit TctC